jgi:uncharacterized protein YlxW (UPF0749 family)
VRVGSAHIVLTVVCLIFGVLLMTQFRTQGKIAKSLQAESSTDQAQIISNLYEANLNLRKEVGVLETQLRLSDENSAQSRAAELSADLQKFRIVNGAAPAVGPGIELTIEADVRREDVQDLINELRNAGAEALSLNGMRVTFRSAVTTDRGAVVVDGQRLIAPYVFSAVGAPDTLERALTRKGGLVSYLQTTYPEGKIGVAKADKLTLPVAASAAAPFKLALPETKPAT